MKTPKRNQLQAVHTRLFREDVNQLRRIATAKGSKWQIELRQLVRKALLEQTITLLDATPKRKPE